MVARSHRSVAVCVCTYRRPEPLRLLLQRLAVISEREAPSLSVGVALVDDDPRASAAEIAAEFRSSFPLGLEYRSTASGNISVARNEALSVGLSMAEWIAFTDDDCLPDPDWLGGLFDVQERFSARCVSGMCVDEPPPGAPPWLTAEPFLAPATTGEDGDALEVGALKNLLIESAFVRTAGLRFDPAFGKIGGEDVMFFRECVRHGVLPVFAARAVVREKIPAERATLRYQLGRSLWFGNTEALTSVAGGTIARWRMFAIGCKLLVTSLATLPVRLYRSRRLPWRSATAGCLQGLGRMLGSLGVRLRHH